MLTLLIALLTGTGSYFAAKAGLHLADIWCVLIGVVMTLAVSIIITLLLKRQINRINAKLQEVMVETQRRLENRQNYFMHHPVGNQKMMLTQLEKEQKAGIEKALEACELFRPLYLWNFIMERQINTMKMAFNYQLKNYAEVDRLMPKCILLDAQSISIALARKYKTNDPKLDKFASKKVRSVRKDDCVLPVSTYAWILVKQNRLDDAVKVLAEARKKTSNEIITANWEALVNAKPKQFSNAKLGEIWYALGLEEMKIPKVQQRFAHR